MLVTRIKGKWLIWKQSFEQPCLWRHVLGKAVRAYSYGRTVLQYCCCLIVILTAWKQFLKISHRKGSTRVRNDRDVMCLPAHDVTVIIFATFKMCYEHFHSTELQYSAYLSQIFWYKRYLFMSFNPFTFWQFFRQWVNLNVLTILDYVWQVEKSLEKSSLGLKKRYLLANKLSNNLYTSKKIYLLSMYYIFYNFNYIYIKDSPYLAPIA